MKRAILFPGQGAQTSGMGKDLYDSNSLYKKSFDEIDSALDFSLKSACFDFENMDKSEYVQPAIFAHSISMYRALGIRADIYAGLSLGEYTALCATGMISSSECAQLVNKRGHIMDNAVDPKIGGMASILGLTIDKVEEIVNDIDNVWVANHLSETQIVIAGNKEIAESLSDKFIQLGARIIPLNTSGPFHTTMLDTAAKNFKRLLDDTNFNEPDAIIYSNYTAKPYQNSNKASELLSKQMSNRVRWHKIIEKLIADGVDEFIEIGPSMTLSKMLKRRLKGTNTKIYSIRNIKTLNKFLAEMECN